MYNVDLQDFKGSLYLIFFDTFSILLSSDFMSNIDLQDFIGCLYLIFFNTFSSLCITYLGLYLRLFF